MLPVVLLLVPRFLLISALGWADTYQGLISTELVSVSGIFLLRQFFLAIPRDLEDAARLEGAGEGTVFGRVVLPQAGPALATLGVLALADQWKSFFWPLVATSSADMQVLEVGIARLHGAYDLNWPYQMAAATAAVIPMVVLYWVARSEEHTSELQSQSNLVCRLLLEKKKKNSCHWMLSLPAVALVCT